MLVFTIIKEEVGYHKHLVGEERRKVVTNTLMDKEEVINITWGGLSQKWEALSWWRGRYTKMIHK
jgi:hypothetical protein